MGVLQIIKKPWILIHYNFIVIMKQFFFFKLKKKWSNAQMEPDAQDTLVMARIVIFNIREYECQNEYFILILANANIFFQYSHMRMRIVKKHANIRICECEYLGHH